jgi:hypothetical protein
MLYLPHYTGYQQRNIRNARGLLLRGLFAALAAVAMLGFCAHARAGVLLSTGASSAIASCDARVAGVE